MLTKDFENKFQEVIGLLEEMGKKPSAAWECPIEDLQKLGFEDASDVLSSPATIAKFMTNWLEEIKVDYPEKLELQRGKSMKEKNVEFIFDNPGDYGVHHGFFNVIVKIDNEEFDLQCCTKDDKIDFNDTGMMWGASGEANEKIYNYFREDWRPITLLLKKAWAEYQS